ncbi:MAG: hypothetical protein RIQ69_1708 [Pseudomonadota bacterium]|jgi:hypothetical protein
MILDATMCSNLEGPAEQSLVLCLLKLGSQICGSTNYDQSYGVRCGGW